ncbi:MAG: hypothetical protein ACYCZB_17730 [Acidiphilium sp.]
MQNAASPFVRRNRLRRIAAAFMVVGLGISLSGCVVVPGRSGGWCYWHPYRCRR